MENNNSRHERLLELVRERVRHSGRSHRELERELDLGHGTLGNILRGRTELRLRHVEMLGRALGFESAELLAEAFGPSAPELQPETPMTREELERIVRKAVQDAFDQCRDPETKELP